MLPPSHEQLPHPSDVGLRARGPTWASACAELVAALGEVMAGGPVRPRDAVSATIDADEDDAFVVALVDECLYQLDANGFVCASADVDGPPSPDGVGVLLRGERFDAHRHGEGVHVKAVTWHDLEVVRSDDGVVITVWLDI